MAAFLDNCRFNPTLGGTTDWTYSSAVTGYQSPALAGVVNGTAYEYFAISADSSQWEIGRGTYNTGTGVLARTTVLFNSSGTGTATGQSGAGTKISFSAAPQVAVVAIKESLLSIEEANSFTATQKDQASVNLGTVRAIKKQVFTASGTYTPSANMLYCIIEAVGGGGGGGGTQAGGGTVWDGGGGGGGGDYSRLLATAATIGASQTVTIGAAGTAGAAGGNNGGAGGDTSVGTLCIGKGGSLGTGGTTTVGGAGGAGGVAGTGDITLPGKKGMNGMYGNFSNNIYGWGGEGGDAGFGFGMGGRIGAVANTASTTGVAGSNYGAGGSGAITTGGAGSGAAGAAGAPGVVVITEFCSA